METDIANEQEELLETSLQEACTPLTPSVRRRLNVAEKTVLEFIDVRQLLADLAALVAIPSLGNEEAPAQELMASKLEELGAKIDKWEIDVASLSAHPCFSMEVPREKSVGVVGTLGNKRGGKSLILNGHVDVVPIGDPAHWRHKPFHATLVGNKVYGRGTCDMKGGIVCALAALRAINAAGISLKGEVLFMSVAGEEDGGLGTLAAMERGYRADGAIVMEPTELCVAPSHAGALGFKVRVHGLSAHACVREEGVSALENFRAVHEALQMLEQRRNRRLEHTLFKRYTFPYALSIGKVQCGDWPSSVPDLLICEGRYGVAPGEDVEEAKREFEEALRAACEKDGGLAQYPPTVEWWGGQYHPCITDVKDPIVQATVDAASDINNAPVLVEGMTYGADLRTLVNLGGIPSVLYGPGNVRQAHQTNEYVLLSDLVTATRTLALTIMRFCGYEGETPSDR